MCTCTCTIKSAHVGDQTSTKLTPNPKITLSISILLELQCFHANHQPQTSTPSPPSGSQFLESHGTQPAQQSRSPSSRILNHVSLAILPRPRSTHASVHRRWHHGLCSFRSTGFRPGRATSGLDSDRGGSQASEGRDAKGARCGQAQQVRGSRASGVGKYIWRPGACPRILLHC